MHWTINENIWFLKPVQISNVKIARKSIHIINIQN